MRSRARAHHSQSHDVLNPKFVLGNRRHRPRPEYRERLGFNRDGWHHRPEVVATLVKDIPNPCGLLKRIDPNPSVRSHMDTRQEELALWQLVLCDSSSGGKAVAFPAFERGW